MFRNNIKAIDIIKYEFEIEESIKKIEEINDVSKLLYIVNNLLIRNIEEENNYEMLKRLRKEKARNFYSMLYDWRIKKTPLQMCVNSMVHYWNKNDNKLIYVGKWGDERRGGHQLFWTNIAYKSKEQCINLAIVRLKEEYDFLENEIIKYIEVLFEAGVLNKSLYELLKYGTNNQNEILLINSGFSYELIKILSKYMKYINFDFEKKEIDFNSEILKIMKSNNENSILINELRFYI